MNACHAMPTGDAASLAGTLLSIDCQLNAAIATAHGRLFGHSGAFTATLTAILTLYVALLALGLIGGRFRLSLSGAMPRVLALGLVLTFATAWPAYQVVVSDLLMRGPDQIASALLGGDGSATLGFMDRLDGLFDDYVNLAQAMQAQEQQTSINLQMSAKLAWAGALLLVLSTIGPLIVARIVLAILLALGPLFFVFALFRGTRGLFEGWLKVVIGTALAPLLLVLGGTGLIALTAPLLDEAMADPTAAGEAVRPVAMLLVAAAVHAATLLGLLWAAVAVTKGWRASVGARTAQTTELSVGSPASGAHESTERMQGQTQRSESDRLSASGSPRISGLAAALLRIQPAAGSPRPPIATSASAVPASASHWRNPIRQRGSASRKGPRHSTTVIDPPIRTQGDTP